MRHKDIRLVEPSVKLKKEFMAMVEEFKTESNGVIDDIGSIDNDNFEDSVRRAKDHAKGIGLPQGWVPANTYWLVCRGHIIGTCDIRHRLTEALRKYGGHIGYAIRPLERGKGYGSQMLALALKKARSLGINKVLVTCADNNIASARIIEKNGGKLADKIPSEKRESLTRRYWIDL